MFGYHWYAGPMFYGEELQRLERKMSNLAHTQVKGRIADSLLSLKSKFGVTTDGAININLSRQDLASYAGTTYETVFRILNEFIQEEIITTDNKNITLLNEKQLKNLTKETE
jgi:CRP-like cAMP-binding protein